MDANQVLPLFNAGGLVALAAVLFYLHTTSLKTFREELAKERQIFSDTAREERIACDRRNDAVIETLKEMGEEVRQQRHATKNLQQAVVLRSALEQELKRRGLDSDKEEDK